MYTNCVHAPDGGELDDTVSRTTVPPSVATRQSARTAPRRLRAVTADAAPLGHCPECGRSVPRGWALIEYERANGERGVFAECPSCEAVVRPE